MTDPTTIEPESIESFYSTIGIIGPALRGKAIATFVKKREKNIEVAHVEENEKMKEAHVEEK